MIIGFVYAAQYAIPGNIAPSGSLADPAGLLVNFYQFGMLLAGVLAFGMVVWAGVQYSLSRGNPTGQADARDRVIQAFLGILLLVGAYAILYTLNPGLTRLQLPTLSPIDQSLLAGQQPGGYEGDSRIPTPKPSASPNTSVGPTVSPGASTSPTPTPTSSTDTDKTIIADTCNKQCFSGQQCRMVSAASTIDPHTTAKVPVCVTAISQTDFCKTHSKCWYRKLDLQTQQCNSGPREVLCTTVTNQPVDIATSCYQRIFCP